MPLCTVTYRPSTLQRRQPPPDRRPQTSPAPRPRASPHRKAAPRRQPHPRLSPCQQSRLPAHQPTVNTSIPPSSRRTCIHIGHARRYIGAEQARAMRQKIMAGMSGGFGFNPLKLFFGKEFLQKMVNMFKSGPTAALPTASATTSSTAPATTSSASLTAAPATTSPKTPPADIGKETHDAQRKAVDADLYYARLVTGAAVSINFKAIWVPGWDDALDSTEMANFQKIVWHLIEKRMEDAVREVRDPAKEEVRLRPLRFLLRSVLYAADISESRLETGRLQ